MVIEEDGEFDEWVVWRWVSIIGVFLLLVVLFFGAWSFVTTSRETARLERECLGDPRLLYGGDCVGVDECLGSCVTRLRGQE